jgi:hypothetical protein
MFNLEQSIAAWRRQMLAAGIKPPAPLDELESHLREDIGSLNSAGMPLAEAFQLAVSRIGGPASLRTEFNKLKSNRCWPVVIGSRLWVYGVVVLAMIFSWNLFAEGRNFLLSAHIFSLTAGYGAAFLAGSFGICYVCYRSFHAVSPVRRQALSRAVHSFSHLAAGLVVVGLILGMLWSRQHSGGWLRGGVREMGGIGACLWLIASAAMQRFGRVSERARMLMCIGGNVIVGLAWFAAGIIASSLGMHSYGMARYWPLGVFLGLHLFFLVMGLTPAPTVAES